MKKFMVKFMVALALLLSCLPRSGMTAMAAQRGWVMNDNGAWTYVNKNGTRAKGYCRYTEGDNKYYFFWSPSYVDQDGNKHETYTLAWDKIIIKESTGEPMYVASKEGPLLENYELTYNGYVYESDSKGVLKKIRRTESKEDDLKDTSVSVVAGAAAASTNWPDGDLWIERASHPKRIQQGKFFPIEGIVYSDGNVQSVLAEIVDEDEEQVHAVRINMNQSEYDLSGEVDEAMVFNDLAPGSYTYRVYAKDNCGNEDWIIWDEFEVVSGQGQNTGSNYQQTGYGDVSAIYQHQETNTDCTVTAVLMMLRSKALREGRDLSELTLSGLKSKYFGASGMAWSGSYEGYSFTSDDVSIKNNSVGINVGQVRYDYLISALSRHPEGVVLYLYDAANSSKAHAVFVSGIENGTIYCLDPYGPSYEIPLANSPTFNSNFGLYDQNSILCLDNTADGRSFLWWCN